MKKLVLSAFLAMATVAAASLEARAQSSCPAAPAAVVVPAGNITANTTWTRNNVYLLNGFVYVPNGVTLTIEPGTIIKGDLANKGTLIVQRGGKLIADGTPTQPIVFTSNQPAGSRAAGDWGGVIICGRAPQNQPGDPIVEGGPIANYGGTDPADNSGILRYVRIEFGGVPLQPNQEINGLTLAAVGNGTTIDYVQVSFSGDDSFEWFGGTVNAKHLIAFRGTDDDFDTDNGYSGRVQFGLGLRDPNVADATATGASNAFESDNDANGTVNSPRTAPVFSNMSVLLPGPLSAAAAEYRRGVHIRRNSALSLFNSVVTGYRAGVLVDGTLTEGALNDGSAVFANNVFADINSGSTTSYFSVNSGSSFNATAYFTAAARANQTFTTVGELGMSASTFRYTGVCTNAACAPDFALPAASSLNNGGAFTDAKLAGSGSGINGAFTPVSYRGAFGSTNWATGWTNFAPQNTCYNRPGQALATKAATDQVQGLSVAPNPTAGAALLSFELKQADVATVRIADALGRQVARIEAGRLGAGLQQLSLPADLQNGVYLATVTTGETSRTVRFVVAK